MNIHNQNNSFQQSTAFMQTSDKSISCTTIRCRSIFHDIRVGLLFVSVIDNTSLNANSPKGKEQNELHFWKLPTRGISNV